MRPWRLTRRARVEMETALAGLRGQVDADKHCTLLLRCAETVEDAAWVMLSDGDDLACWPEETTSLMFPRSRHVRILRARVALALRAALRADEDARCEEALARAVLWWPEGYGYDQGREGAAEAADEMREWPELRLVLCGEPRVPRALWEVVR